MKTTEKICPKNRKEWREWLKQNHQTKDAIWIVVYKQSSATPTITWSDAVDEALCFGWIDSTKKSIDKDRYMQYYSKRKPNSTWSKVNKNKVQTLVKANLMTNAGLNVIELAKENGSWTILDSVEALQIPDELEQAFKSHPGSKTYYNSLSKSLKRGLLAWIAMAKRPATKTKRIRKIVENLKEKVLPKNFR